MNEKMVSMTITKIDELTDVLAEIRAVLDPDIHVDTFVASKVLATLDRVASRLKKLSDAL